MPPPGVASAKATVTGLRSLLRFLYLDGQITCHWPEWCRPRRDGCRRLRCAVGSGTLVN
jgi:hypothetical protein